MLILEIQAPFAASRPMAAGWHRATTPLITPSAIYGLLLNLAAVETRLREEAEEHDGNVPASLTRPGLPVARLALGVPAGVDLPRTQTIFQQLHNYPVGRDAGMPPELAKGTKNNITPVRREFLSSVHLVVLLEDDPELADRIRRGLAGEWNDRRYGLPFLGDNSFLVDRIVELERSPACRWYERLEAHETPAGSLSETARLTVWIDRADMTRTESALFAPGQHPVETPSEKAWTWINPR